MAESRCTLARLNSLITTHSRISYSLLSLSLSLLHRHATRAGYLECAPPDPFLPRISTLTGSFTYHGFHAGFHPESGYDSVVRPAPPFGPFPFLLYRSLSLFTSPLTPRFPLARTLLPHHRLYIARKFRTPQTRGSSRISRVRISPSGTPLSHFFSLPLSSLSASSHSLSFSLSSSSFFRRLSCPWIYTCIFPCISFLLVPPLFGAHASPLLLLFFLSLAPSILPPLICKSTFERSISLLPPYLFLPGSRHTRFPRSFCPVSFHHRCRAAVPSHPFTSLPRLSPSCIAQFPPLLPRLTPRLHRALSSPLCPARSLMVSSSVRCTSLSISPVAEGFAFTSGSSLGPAPVSCFA